MRIGMLWFDSSEQRDLATKLRRAAQYYETKYGARATLCYVHPSMMSETTLTLDGIEVRTSNTVLPHHFWLGSSSEETQRHPAA
jgi:hypothetical protein